MLYTYHNLIFYYHPWENTETEYVNVQRAMAIRMSGIMDKLPTITRCSAALLVVDCVCEVVGLGACDTEEPVVVVFESVWEPVPLRRMALRYKTSL